MPEPMKSMAIGLSIGCGGVAVLAVAWIVSVAL